MFKKITKKIETAICDYLLEHPEIFVKKEPWDLIPNDKRSATKKNSSKKNP